MTLRPHEAFHDTDATLLAFTENLIETDSENRSDEDAVKALAEPGARLLLIGRGRVCLKARDGGFEPYFAPREADALSPALPHAVLLGRVAGRPVLASPCRTVEEEGALPAGITVADLRSLFVEGLVAPEALGAVAQGAALLSWHENHRFCGRCGGETAMRAGGYRRVCEACGREHFPRTDPVAIMLAVRGENCLLGRSPRFRPGMYSCLAGFIEPGETIEAAVRRETFEEAGVRLGRVTYRASQPWPFPHSLMIGCLAEALGEAVDYDARELEDCRWFSRAEVRRMLEGTHEAGLLVPPEGAIAHYLIAGWAGPA